MGASLWDHVWLPLLIGVAIAIVVGALRFVSVRLWNCLMKLFKTQIAVGESAHDQPLPDSDAAAHANGVPALEMGNGNGPAQGGESTTEPGLELGIVNSGNFVIEHFSDQEAHTPGIKSPVTTPKAQVTRDAAREALVPVEMDVPHSQQEETAAAVLNEAPVENRKVVDVGHDCYTVPEALHGSTSIIFLLMEEFCTTDDPTSLGYTGCICP